MVCYNNFLNYSFIFLLFFIFLGCFSLANFRQNLSTFTINGQLNPFCRNDIEIEADMVVSEGSMGRGLMTEVSEASVSCSLCRNGEHAGLVGCITNHFCCNSSWLIGYDIDFAIKLNIQCSSNVACEDFCCTIC